MSLHMVAPLVTRRELSAAGVGALSFVLFMCGRPFEEGDEPEQPSLTASAVEPHVILAAGDIARCGLGGDETTALVLDSLLGVHPDATVVPLGDLVYPAGTAANFRDCYGPSWGRHKARSKPVLGNHEYDASPTAQFYFDYFNGVSASEGPAGPPGKGYHSWNPHPSWHIVTLNTNSGFVPTKAGSPQGKWLLADLEANTRPCVLALFHHPRFISQAKAPLSSLNGYTLYPWQRLTAVTADLAVNASQHFYERFAPQLADGTASPDGLRQIIVGTGGASGAPPFTAIRPNSVIRESSARGVLKLELGEGFYRWEFVSVPGRTFTDRGTSPCHNALPAIEPPVDTMPTDSTPPPVDSTPPPESEPPPPEPEPPPPPPPSSINLTVTGSSDATKNYMTLKWTGASGTSVDVYRNGPLLTTTPNDGHYVNSRALQPGGVTYAYKVCGMASAVCSNEVRVTFE